MTSKTLANNFIGGMPALSATLRAVTVMLALLAPAYCQQDVAPTWYDPTATASEAAAQQQQQAEQQTPSPKNKKLASSASPTGHKSKTQARARATTDRNRPVVLAAKMTQE